MKTLAKNVMTQKLITIPLGSSLFDAQKIMTQHQIRHLPVESQKGEILGIVSLKDLSSIQDSKIIPVEVVMKSPIRSVRQDLPLRQAVHEMLELKISCLLITDELDQVVGILTTDDLLSYLANLLEKENTEHRGPFDPMNLETIGEVANQISMMGI